MASLREVLATFTVDLAPAAAELTRGNRLVDDLVGKLKGLGAAFLGAFAVDAIVGKFNALAQEADELAKAAQGLGLAASELQELEHAAGLSGVSVGALRAALQRLQRTVADSADGGGQGAEAFKKLGIELKNADGTVKTSGQVFEEAATAIAGIENPTERAGAANKLFGRSYAQLIPLLAEGGEGIKKLRAEVKELGFGFDEAFLENAQEYNDNIDRFKAGLKGLAIQAIGPLLPHLVRFSQWLVEATKRFVAWWKTSKLLEAALYGLAIKSVGPLVRAIQGAVAGLGGLRAAFMRLLPFILKTVAPLLAIEDVLVFLAGGESLLGDAIDAAFGEGSQEKVRAFAATVTTGLNDILTTARTNNAEFRRNWQATLDDARKEFEGTFGGQYLGGILAAALDTFFVFINGASNGFSGLKDTIIALAGGIFFSFVVLGEDIQHIFRVAVSHVQDLFGGLFNSIQDGAQGVAATLEAVLSKIPGMSGAAKDIGAAIRDTGHGGRFDTGNVDRELARHKDVGKYLLGVGEDIEQQLRGPGREERARQDAERNFRAVPTGQPYRFDLGQPGVVAAPAAPVTNIKQEVSAPIKVQNTFYVPQGTDAEQQRSIQQSATSGTRKALDPAAIQAAIPVPG